MTPISTDMIREFGLTTALVVSLRTFSHANRAFTVPEQQRISDTCGVCSTQILNVGRITLFMPEQKSSPSTGGASGFDKAK